MKRFIFAALAVICAAACSGPQTFQGDPLDTQIYTLDNGLKVYMSVNKAEPKIQTYIAVRVGGKNDPADNTGLAHYLEHLMFKGSELAGTTDFAAEKPLLDQIEDLYEVYRTKTDDAERRAIYHVIDSLSYQASLISIPNEYDKAMSLIGSTGSNAFTSNDVTCYQENIPSNQIENWAKVQSDRFKHMVIRGFHTELEAVYEEFNMYLNEDSENAMIAIDETLFPHHPYGTQTVIGTQAHLKNPSIKTIKNQKATYYVPNNVAICLSGDFDPKEMISIIKKYFGDWEPNKNLPEFTFEKEQPLTSPVETTVYGTEAEFVMMGWSYPGEATADGEIAEIASSVLYNGMAGLIDLDINQSQKALGAGISVNGRSDYGELLFIGYPKEGQSLEEVRDLLLAEASKLRNGEFDEDLIKAAVSNLKLSDMRSLERNSSRAMKYVNSFVNGSTWEWEIGKNARLEALTKDDIVAWAQKYLPENGYALCFKRLGENKNANKIVAPAITPIATNRDKQSDFLTEIQNSTVKNIEPVFVDYGKDMSVLETESGLSLLYKKNETNDIATARFVWGTGIIDNPALSFAADYISFLGTPSRSAGEIAAQLYSLACNFSISIGANQTSISVNGLSENLGAALEIVEDLILNARADEMVLSELKSDEMKNRAESGFNQRACTNALSNYLQYGPDYIRKTTLSNKALAALTSADLLSSISDLLRKQHEILYYGPSESSEVKTLLAEHHKAAASLEPLAKTQIKKVVVNEPKVFVAPYDSRQFTYNQYSNRDERYDISKEAVKTLFNAYFGGGMNGIVFQEMREARALAYSAGATLGTPSFKEDSYTFTARIGSQNDKLRTAVEAFDLIINDMPQSQNAFDIAKASIEGQLRTKRTTGMSVLSSYVQDREMGLSEPVDKLVFEALGALTLDDLSSYHQEMIKGRTYQYSILGDWNDLDKEFLSKLGPVKKLSLEEIFGY